MKKFTLSLGVLLIFILPSCNKASYNRQATLSSTTQQNLRSDATGVTLSAAGSVARSFLQAKNPNITVTIRNAQTIVKNGVPYFHVINTNAGFVILSPDSLYRPILAYDIVDNFSFANKDLNAGLLAWLNKHAHELDYVRNNKSPRLDSIGKANKVLWAVYSGATVPGSLASARAIGGQTKQNDVLPPTLISQVPTSVMTTVTVGPLCQTLWGQQWPFNEDCPAGTYSGGFVPAGCVPVAMAQIMRFWSYPATYNWAGMPLTYYQALISPVGDLPRVISNIGTTVGTSYANSGSGTDMSNVVPGFNAFGYSSATVTQGLTQQALSGADDGTTYASLMTNEIQTNRRPCIASGFTGYSSVFGLGILPTASGDGHTWVCDGSEVMTIESGYIYTYKSFYGVITTQTLYDETQVVRFLHMNWGWPIQSGAGTVQGDQQSNALSNNGWYDCDVNYTQASSVSENFQYFQIIVYNIHP